MMNLKQLILLCLNSGQLCFNNRHQSSHAMVKRGIALVDSIAIRVGIVANKQILARKVHKQVIVAVLLIRRQAIFVLIFIHLYAEHCVSNQFAQIDSAFGRTATSFEVDIDRLVMHKVCSPWVLGKMFDHGQFFAVLLNLRCARVLWKEVLKAVCAKAIVFRIARNSTENALIIGSAWLDSNANHTWFFALETMRGGLASECH